MTQIVGVRTWSLGAELGSEVRTADSADTASAAAASRVPNPPSPLSARWLCQARVQQSRTHPAASNSSTLDHKAIYFLHYYFHCYHNCKFCQARVQESRTYPAASIHSTLDTTHIQVDTSREYLHMEVAGCSLSWHRSIYQATSMCKYSRQVPMRNIKCKDLLIMGPPWPPG